MSDVTADGSTRLVGAWWLRSRFPPDYFMRTDSSALRDFAGLIDDTIAVLSRYMDTAGATRLSVLKRRTDYLEAIGAMRRLLSEARRIGFVEFEEVDVADPTANDLAAITTVIVRSFDENLRLVSACYPIGGKEVTKAA